MVKGINVITESVIKPSLININIIANVGTRDESLITSGFCNAIKHTFLRNQHKISERDKYARIAFSGSQIDIDYDRDSIIVKL